MAPPAQRRELRPRRRPSAGLSKRRPVADQHLVRAEDQPVRLPRRHAPRLELREGVGDVARRRALGAASPALTAASSTAAAIELERHPRAASSAARAADREARISGSGKAVLRRSRQGPALLPRPPEARKRAHAKAARRPRPARFLGTLLWITAGETGRQASGQAGQPAFGAAARCTVHSPRPAAVYLCPPRDNSDSRPESSRPSMQP